VDELRASAIKTNVAAGISEAAAPSGQCLPGKARLLVDVDGNLFPCERVNESDIMRIGNLEQGFDYDKARRLLNIAELTAE